MSWSAERIAPGQLDAALLEVQRRPGWNLRNTPVRKLAVGTCTVFVVPAKCWAYWRRSPCLIGEGVRLAKVSQARALVENAHDT